MSRDRAFCKHCQYTLARLTGNVCPECGTPFDLSSRRSFTRHPRLRKSWRGLTIAALGSLVLYVASYYYAVQIQPASMLNSWQKVYIILSGRESGGEFTLELEASYRVGGKLAAMLYSPIHIVDRKLRSDRWSVHMKPPQLILWAGM